MAKLRDVRKNRPLPQIEDTGMYVRNVPVSEIERLSNAEEIDKIFEDNPNDEFSRDEAFMFLLFRDIIVDKAGEPFEDIEGPEDLKEILDIDAINKIFRYFGLGRVQQKLGN